MASYIRADRGPILIGGVELLTGEYMPYDSSDDVHAAVQAEITAGRVAATVVSATNPAPLAKTITHTAGSRRNW